MSDFDYSNFSITVLAQEIDEEQVRVKNLEDAIADLPEARDRLAALRAEMLKRVSPEQPQTSDPQSSEGESMFAGMTFETKELPEGVLAEVVSANGKVSIVDDPHSNGTHPEQQD